MFTDKWVCVTRTEGKHRYDEFVAISKGKGAVDSKPMRDASMGDLGIPLPTPKRVEAPPKDLRPELAALDAIRAFPQQEAELRKAVEAPLVRKSEGPTLGIALAGGGSKAAAFGTGVLAGLADSELLDSAQYLSTVSGGGYAAYFYYAHKILPRQRWMLNADSVPSSKTLYRDCQRLPTGQASPEILRKVERYQEGGACDVDELSPRRDAAIAETIKYQMFKRCQQDILQPGQCSVALTGDDWGISGLTAATTLLTAPPSWLTTIVFDWGRPTSPAAIAYRDGIGMAYGTTVTNTQPLLELGRNGMRDAVVRCPPEATAFARDCVPGPHNPSPSPMTYNELLKGMQVAKAEGNPMPFWIINAVATKNRSGMGWFTNAGKFDTLNSDTFEMTPVTHGSGRYGFVSTNMGIHGFDVLMSVGAAAAFLDPNQNVAGGRLLRGPIGVAQRLLNVDWGIDISNYNVLDARRTLHTAMPFPFFDAPLSGNIVHFGQPEEDKERVGSVFIRLIDGGNGDNLGLYSLLRRGVDIAVVSDAAADNYGIFDDLCEVMRRLTYAPERTAKVMRIPGLQNMSNHCADLSKGAEIGYGLREWPFSNYPVLLGCVRFEERAAKTRACDKLEKGETRLFIVKPAINLRTLRSKQYASVAVGGTFVPTLEDCTLPGEVYRSGVVNCGTAAFVMATWQREKGNCQSFPQHSTVLVTANSSATIFSAYRELGRQYTAMAGELIKRFQAGDVTAGEDFDGYVEQQFEQNLSSRSWTDPNKPPCGGPAERMPRKDSIAQIIGSAATSQLAAFRQ